MPVMKMRQLGSVGVVSDMPAYELPPNAWSDALNVRFQGTRITKIGGNLPTMTAGMPSNTIPLSVTSYGTNLIGVGSSVMYGTSNSIYQGDAAAHKNVSKPSEVDGVPYNYLTDGKSWNSTTISNSLVMNTPNETPQGFQVGQTTFLDLPNWGKTFIDYASDGSISKSTNWYWRTNKIRTYSNFLIALNMTESNKVDGAGAVNFGQRVRWSDISDVNSLPNNWDDSSTTNSAGYNDLTNSQGVIMDGIALRDSFMIYTTNEIYSMQYIGGNSIFRFSKVFDNTGVMGVNCVAEFEGNHFVVSRDDIFVHNGSTKNSVVSGRVKDKLITEITSANPESTKVFAHNTAKEIWICYSTLGVESGELYTTKAAVWNWEFNTWGFYELPAVTDIQLINIPTSSVGIETWESFGDAGEVWENDSISDRPWDKSSGNFSEDQVVCSSAHGRFYVLDTGTLFHSKVGNSVSGQETVRTLTATLERDFIDFDEMEINPWQNKRIRRVYPQFHGEGTIRVYVQGNGTPYEFPSYSTAEPFEIASAIKTDHRINNKYISVKFVDDSGGDWSFSGYDMDFILGGNR